MDLSRFKYPITVEPVRVPDSRFVSGSRDIVHLVQLAPDGVVKPARWMDERDWRELVGMVAV
jgi:hypothetical protein